MSFKTADGIKVFTREDWGARRPNGSFGSIGHVFCAVIHHGGPVGGRRMTFAKAAQTCRDWQSFHQNTNGWTDIGYHYLVDGLGRLYQGRPTSALGAHVLGQNTGRVGINFMQDGRFFKLNFFQRRTLKKLLRKPHRQLGLPALNDLVVLCHRDVPGQSTVCPGDLIAKDLRNAKRAIA